MEMIVTTRSAPARLPALAIATLEEAVFDAAPVGLALVAQDGRIQQANARCCALLGLGCEGRRLDSWILEGATAVAVRAALANGSEWRGECRFVDENHEDPTWVSLAVARVGRGDDAAIVAIEDIGDRRRMIQTLQVDNAGLRRTNEARSAFVSIVSHELRTPLTAIRGAFELLSGGHLGEVTSDQQRFLMMGVRNLDRLGAILDDLLDLSKIDAGQLSLSCASVDALAVATDVVETFRQRAVTRGLQLELALDDSVAPVWGDAGRLAQVLSNLISNAIKFTPGPGRIEVEVAAAEGGLALSVRDTGIGIAPEHQQRVFERFWQVEQPLDRSVGGSGLGLAIARDIVEAHGGALKLTSAAGEGSCFEVFLPADSEVAREQAELETALIPHRRYPSFGLLVLEPHHPGDGGLVGVAVAAKAALPRTCDEVVLQPAAGRVVVVLGTTDRAGAQVVCRRLRSRLGEIACVHGPAAFPEDGRTAVRLVEATGFAELVPEGGLYS